MRVKDLPIDLRELFEPEDFDVIQCIGMEKKTNRWNHSWELLQLSQPAVVKNVCRLCKFFLIFLRDLVGWVGNAVMWMIAINDIKDGIKIKRNGNYWIDGFNQINWSDGTNGTECVRIDGAAGSVWFHCTKCIFPCNRTSSDLS